MMDYKMAENIIEITWVFDELKSKNKIADYDEISDVYSAGTTAASDIIKDNICEWAKEFEETGSKEDYDYLDKIRKFAKNKIIEAFGIEKKYVVTITMNAKANSTEQLYKDLKERFGDVSINIKRGDNYED